MAEQNQDLPLVVSEILIEMHELRGDIKELQKVTVHLSHSVEKLEVEMREVKTVIGQLSSAVVQLAGSCVISFVLGNTTVKVAPSPSCECTSILPP